MDEGNEVTWIPSYGPEMRGGTANCTVIIADDEIGSPLVRHPQAFIAMNLPSLDKYEAAVRTGGVIVINSSVVGRKAAREDITSVMVPGNEIAEELGDRRMTNMVLIGGLLAQLPVLSLEALGRSLEAHLPSRHLRLLPLNKQALRRGAECAALQMR
jgi:2-oxoglutarate ferredoxin oxidoreductase subunit gamma